MYKISKNVHLYYMNSELPFMVAAKEKNQSISQGAVGLRSSKHTYLVCPTNNPLNSQHSLKVSLQGQSPTPSAMRKWTPLRSVLSRTKFRNALMFSGRVISPSPSTPPSPDGTQEPCQFACCLELSENPALT